MAKRRNPDEKEAGNPLVVVGIVVVVGIAGYFLFFRKPKESTEKQSRQKKLDRQRRIQQTQPTDPLAQILGAAAQMYGAHTQTQIKMAQLKAQRY